MLHRDDWLSRYFDGGAYAYKPPFDAAGLPEGFLYSKTSVENIQNVKKLCAQGFSLVETLVKFAQKDIIMCPLPGYTVRLSKPEDRESVANIARGAFTSSRLYQDPNIPNETASQIKADWVENFYNGARGDAMIIVEDQSGIHGFLLLIGNVIDLIAVSPAAHKKGIASAMIAKANEQIGPLSAGTQIINAPSIALYQKCEFHLQSAQHVLHCHNFKTGG